LRKIGQKFEYYVRTSVLYKHSQKKRGKRLLIPGVIIEKQKVVQNI